MKIPIGQATAQLALDLASSKSLNATVTMITAFAAETMLTSHAGVTLIHGEGKPFDTTGATDNRVEAADKLQNSLREGPCIDAAVGSRSVLSNDLARDDRWPRWGPGAVSLGFGSILSSEMHAGNRRIGALNIYGPIGHLFSREDAETAQVLAYHAAAALTTVDTIEGLTRALDSRTLIGQAQGILMERFQVDADRAFSILRRYSQDENIRLVEVARQLIQHRDLPSAHA